MTELVDSFVDNGFFATEPLLVTEETPGHFTVIEGNRRLAALMWMLQIPPGDEVPLDRDIPRESLRAVESVPVVVVENRDSVSTFLGYRHISGLKPWAPEAKARFIADEIDRKAKGDHANPFALVGRAFGSNATGMRNAYLAYRILEHARDEHRINVSHVLNQRFGVWTRCLNSMNIRRFIGLDRPTAYEEVQVAIEKLDPGHLRDVILDLTPTNGRPALLSDSREITQYGQVLASPAALRVLRDTSSLEAAKILILDIGLSIRLETMAEQAKRLMEEMLDLETATPEIEHAVSQLHGYVKKMRSLLATLVEED